MVVLFPAKYLYKYDKALGLISLCRCKSTAPHIYFLRGCCGRYVEVKDIHRKTQRRARIRNVYQTSNVALDWSTAEHEVDLVVRVAFHKTHPQ